MRQHQLREGQGAACGAQRQGARADAGGLRPGHQAHAQALGRLGTGLAHQAVHGQAPGQRHRQQRLVVHVGRAAADQGDRQRRVQRAQRLGHGPAGTSAAHDHHPRRRFACHAGPGRGRAWCRTRRRAHRRGIGREVRLGHLAQRTGPVIGNVLVTGARCQPAVRVALGLVVDPAAGVADVLAVRDGGLGGGAGHGRAPVRIGFQAGRVSAHKAATSLRRCLMAGVTMATNCASRTRRCTSELIR